ncbi:hypothetical protein LTR05_002202 [Lithohypha guttulata]|uniref:Sucrose transporter n=1 Tax=Lithohypha guttulata TaxID=1690604 RepID=A0AAN7T1Z6_9EURO|nr:hypothetical protein LTR05_002202 [Lithohypha guttulata]
MARKAAAEWVGTPRIRGGSEPVRMILLTFSLIGLQLTWGLEQTYCTPYLLSLGMSKSTTSAVWIAGPLSGLLVQPIVGAMADRCTSKYGRRRPFMVGGSAVTSLCLILLGWTKELVSIFVSTDSQYGKKVVIVTAVLSIYALDFAINVVQACCRSIIVDVLPTQQQQTGSAWAARMAASGHVIGFMIGTLPLVDILPTWIGGDTQFKKMCLVATLGLWFAISTTCYAVQERVLLRRSEDDSTSGITGVLASLWKRIWNLPPRIQMICWCQFWGWIGWFPFLFYSSTWVGETYYRYEHPEKQNQSQGGDALGNIGRLGSLALVLFSVITFASSVLMPYFVRKPEDDDETGTGMNGASKSSRGRFTPRPPPSLSKTCQTILMRIYEKLSTYDYKPDLVTTWGLSNLAFALIMVWAPFVRSLAFATTLVALCGLPWAVSCWAPFAEMGIEINKLAHGGNANGSISVTAGAATNRGYVPVRPSMDIDDEDDDIELVETANRHVRSASVVSSGVLHLSHSHDDGTSSSTGELAGIYLGVLNVYTTLPQFVGTFISWVVFSLLEPSRTTVVEEGGGGATSGTEGDVADDHKKFLKLEGVNSIAVCLFIGAVCAVVAAEATRRLRKMS